MSQKLEVFQSLWAMEQRRPGVPERPLACCSKPTAIAP